MLTAKQERFAQAVAIDGLDFSAAYRIAYNAENMLPATINRNAHASARNSKVAARIANLRLPQVAEVDASAARIITELAAVGFTPLTDLVMWNTGGERMVLKASNELTPAQAASILSVKVKRRRIVDGRGEAAIEWEIDETEIKQHNKLEALGLLAKRHAEFSEKIAMLVADLRLREEAQAAGLTDGETAEAARMLGQTLRGAR